MAYLVTYQNYNNTSEHSGALWSSMEPPLRSSWSSVELSRVLFSYWNLYRFDVVKYIHSSCKIVSLSFSFLRRGSPPLRIVNSEEQEPPSSKHCLLCRTLTQPPWSPAALSQILCHSTLCTICTVHCVQCALCAAQDDSFQQWRLSELIHLLQQEASWPSSTPTRDHAISAHNYFFSDNGQIWISFGGTSL